MAPKTPTKHTHTFQTEVINSRAFDFHMQNPKPDVPPPSLEGRVSAAVRLHDLAGQIKEERGAECYR